MSHLDLYSCHSWEISNQVIITLTLTLPHQGGGDWGAPKLSPPLVGGGWERGIKKETPIQSSCHASFVTQLSIIERNTSGFLLE